MLGLVAFSRLLSTTRVTLVWVFLSSLDLRISSSLPPEIHVCSIMGMSNRGGNIALHAIECSFGSHLVLMNKEKFGAILGNSAVPDQHG